jgi:hypothetical protein
MPGEERQMQSTGRRMLIAVAVMPLLALGGGYLWLRQVSLPSRAGTLTLSGLQEEVIILWQSGDYLPVRRGGYRVADTLVLKPAP